jgi:hypothetical protein
VTLLFTLNVHQTTCYINIPSFKQDISSPISNISDLESSSIPPYIKPRSPAPTLTKQHHYHAHRSIPHTKKNPTAHKTIRSTPTLHSHHVCSSISHETPPSLGSSYSPSSLDQDTYLDFLYAANSCHACSGCIRSRVCIVCRCTSCRSK